MHALPLTARFRWKLAPAILIVAIADWLFYQKQLHGGNFGFFTLALLGALLAGRRASWHDRRAWTAMAVAAVYSLALIYDSSFLAWTLFWIAASVATLIPGTARFDDGWRWFQRLFWQALVVPFGSFIDLWRLRKLRVAGRSSRWNLHTAIAMFGLPVAGSFVILILFSAANPLFERLLSSMFVPQLSPRFFGRVALWGIWFAMVWSLLRPRLKHCLFSTFDGRGDLALPGVSIMSVTISLVAFNLLFALQNLMDVAYLWGLAAIPEGMTLADYAHRGAYPLIVTAMLAALFVLVTLRPGSMTASAPAIRRMVIIWIAQNIFLVTSSMLRTVDYIEVYSLTRLRIAALIWMALIAFGLAAICWRLLRDRSASWLINVNLAAAALVLTSVCFIDLGTIAARWNVEHAREVGGNGVALDLCHMRELGSSALLPLITLERIPNLRPAFRERVQAVRTDLLNGLRHDQKSGPTLLGQWQLAQADRMLAGHLALRLQHAEQDYAGSIYPPVYAPTSLSHSPTFTPEPAEPEKPIQADQKAVRALTEEIGK